MIATAVRSPAARRPYGVLLLLLAAADVRASEQILVPQDHPTIAAAVAAAAPGDRILVSGGVHGPVVVDKALSIVGRLGDRPMVRVPVPGEPGGAAITLAGPGSGRVVLANLDVGGDVDGTFFGDAHEGVAGGGFDILLVENCFIEAGTWVMPTGLGDGAAGIDVDLPLLMLDDCTVFGGAGIDDGSGLALLELPVPGPAVVTTGDVVVNVTGLVGGAGTTEVITDPLLCAAPDLCDLFGPGAGEGAPGLVARDVLGYGDSVNGGTGAVLRCGSTTVCTFATGPSMVVDSYAIAPGNSLAGQVAPTPGGTWNVGYFPNIGDPLSPVVALLASAQPALPLQLPEGPLFMDPATMVVKLVPTTSLAIFTVTVPNDPRLLGVTLVTQWFDPAVGLDMPLHETVSMP